jgi:AGCS family alanine or glycine:cation symporter
MNHSLQSRQRSKLNTLAVRLASLLSLILIWHGPTVTAQSIDPSPTVAQASQPAGNDNATELDSADDGSPEKKEDAPSAATFQDKINENFASVVAVLEGVIFYKVPLLISDQTAPLVLLVLIFGGIFFTLRFGFINIRLFRHSINVIRGKYDKPEDEGEITHFQALTSALSATVGLGNIGGVAIAIALGGPGAIFWMWCIAFFGMSAKFTSCAFAQLYRRVRPDGTVLGGPMVYLDEGIKEHYPRLGWLGTIFGISFAVFTILASLGGGNMFQGNQTFKIVSEQLGVPSSYDWLFGVVMAILVGIVIIGGIKRIGDVTSKIVPAMCLFYCVCCLIIILSNASQVPTMLGSIFTSAFQPDAIFSGGIIGVLLIGAQRAAFSNEAGLGSAAIAHAAARTEEPIREGVVAMIGPFIDTIIVCTMTALTILITNSHIDVATGQPFAEALAKEKDVALTAAAFATLGSWVPYLLCAAVFVFAYSTMISWSYYGDRAAEYLFGEKGIRPYRILFLIFVILGPIVSLETVIAFSDMMLFSMAFPNIIGLILLSGILVKKARDYVTRLESGEISRTH